MHEVSVVKDFIELYSLALLALAFTLYTISVARITAFNIVLISAIVLHIIHAHITRNLIPLFGVEEYKSVIFYLWYLSFGVTDVLLVVVCYKIIERYDLLTDRASQFILIMFLFLAFLQFGRLGLREFGVEWGGEIYKNGVVFTNILITVVPCLMASRAVLVRTGKVLLSRKEV